MDSGVRALILKMADANPLWGAPKIHGELLELGIVVSEWTVSNLLRHHRRKPPSQTWRTFIKNHIPDMVGVDFVVVPTIRFRLLFVFIILSHSRRRVVHFNGNYPGTDAPAPASGVHPVGAKKCRNAARTQGVHYPRGRALKLWLEAGLGLGRGRAGKRGLSRPESGASSRSILL